MFSLPGGLAALAAAAIAATAGASGAPSGPVPADVSRPSPVHIQLDVIDARGKVVEHLDCSWEYAPEDDDRECLDFQGDPQNAIAHIREAGGVRVVKHLQAPTKGIDTTTRISKRRDGVWVFRTTGTVDGEPWRYVRTWDPS
jgi:hypothetical protein